MSYVSKKYATLKYVHIRPSSIENETADTTTQRVNCMKRNGIWQFCLVCLCVSILFVVTVTIIYFSRSKLPCEMIHQNGHEDCAKGDRCDVARIQAPRRVYTSKNATRAHVANLVEGIFGSLPQLTYTVMSSSHTGNVTKVWNVSLSTSPNRSVLWNLTLSATLQNNCTTLILQEQVGQAVGFNLSSVAGNTSYCTLRLPTVENLWGTQGLPAASALRAALARNGVFMTGGTIAMVATISANLLKAVRHDHVFVRVNKVVAYGCSREGKSVVLLGYLSDEITHIASLCAGSLGVASNLISGKCGEVPRILTLPSRWGAWYRNNAYTFAPELPRWHADFDALLWHIASRGKQIYVFIANRDYWNNPLAQMATYRSARQLAVRWGGHDVANRITMYSVNSHLHCGFMAENARNFGLFVAGTQLVFAIAELEDEYLMNLWLSGNSTINKQQVQQSTNTAYIYDTNLKLYTWKSMSWGLLFERMYAFIVGSESY